MGINYIGSSNQLDGSISYVQNVKRFICGKSCIHPGASIAHSSGQIALAMTLPTSCYSPMMRMTSGVTRLAKTSPGRCNGSWRMLRRTTRCSSISESRQGAPGLS